MQLSVILLNYNVRYFLEHCILSVEAALANIEAEIIVIDNNSSDDSCAMMKERFPAIKLIENAANLGFPKGNNAAVAVAKGDYICILNPDTVVAEDTFEKILDFAKRQNNLGIIGCKLIDGSGNFLPESKRGIPTPFVAFTKIMGFYKLFPKSKIFGKYYANHLDADQSGKVEILVGAFMVMKRELYLEVGGFDEDCFMYSDDIDLSYQVLKKGKDNYYFHESTVIHYKGESTVKDGTYMKRFQEAMHFFYKKHFKVSILFSVFMDIGTFIFTFLKKNKRQLAEHKPEGYLLISKEEKLKSALENVLEKKVHLISSSEKNNINSLLDNLAKPVEIIFDSNFLSFKFIIASMEQFKSSKTTFKIVPKRSNYGIGSNSSNERGTIIKIFE